MFVVDFGCAYLDSSLELRGVILQGLMQLGILYGDGRLLGKGK